MARSEKPDSGKAQSQWYGDEAQWYPETRSQWLSDAADAENEPSSDEQNTVDESEAESTRVEPGTARETRHDLPLPGTKADPEPAPEEKPASHGQDGPPPPFVDRPVAKNGPPPAFESAEEAAAAAAEAEAVPEPAEPAPDYPDEDLVLRKPIVLPPDEDLGLEKPVALPPAAHKLPPAPQPAYQAPPQAAYPPPPPVMPPGQAMQPPPTLQRPRSWHRMHTPVGVFLVVFGLGTSVNAAYRWSDHRAELSDLLNGTLTSLADSAAGLLVAAHVVEVLLVVVALAGLARRRSVWFLPTILGWMVGFGVFAGLNVWAGNTARSVEQVAYLGGFTILLFLSYALGVKARVDQRQASADAAAAAAYHNQPLTRTQEMALAALNSWHRRQGHPS